LAHRLASMGNAAMVALTKPDMANSFMEYKSYF
jgi:hypothetical protein